MLANLFTNLFKINQRGKVNMALEPLKIKRVGTYEDYIVHFDESQQANKQIASYEKGLVPDSRTQFTFNGYCYVCKAHVDFLVDFNYSYEVDGKLTPNWRERLECPRCRLNNRMRAIIHMLDLEYDDCSRRNPVVYITEQLTPLYKALQQRYPILYGSEYLGSSVACGAFNGQGVRNEDLTRLSFTDHYFDIILSFDVFEHVPDYSEALAECFRCLKPGGVLIFTVPFDRASARNIVRARYSADGTLEHLLPPEYHGDPINSEGCLSFYTFGWELLQDLISIGFVDAQALLYYSKFYGYLGGEQLILTASK